MAPLQLSERQQATIAVAVTLLCAVFILSFIGGLFLLFGLTIIRFSSVLLPLAVAGVLALILKPFHAWITARLKGRAVLAVILVYLAILLPVTLFGLLFGARVLSDASEFVTRVPEWVDAAQVRMEQHMPALKSYWQEHDVGARLKGMLETHGATIARSMGSMTGFAVEAWAQVFRSVAGLLSWIILPIYLGFFLLGEPVTKERFEGLLPFLKASTRNDVSYLVFEFVDILVSFFRGQFVIAFIQGLLYAIGFSAIGLDYGFTLGLVLGFLNVIPYLGSMVGLSIGLPLAFFQPDGGVLLVGLVIAIFTVVQCIEGYFLTPKIMGDRTGLHPLVIIVAIFFWGSVFGGITGMILAIPLTAFLVVLWRLLKTKYIREML